MDFHLLVAAHHVEPLRPGTGPRDEERYWREAAARTAGAERLAARVARIRAALRGVRLRLGERREALRWASGR